MDWNRKKNPSLVETEIAKAFLGANYKRSNIFRAHWDRVS